MFHLKSTKKFLGNSENLMITNTNTNRNTTIKSIATDIKLTNVHLPLLITNTKTNTKTINSNVKLIKTKTKRLLLGCTALMHACQQGRFIEVLDQIHSNPEQLYDRDKCNKNLLHYCVSQVETDSSHLVAAAGIAAAAPELLESADEDGFTPIHLAVIQGNLAMVNLLLANKADVNAVDNEGHSVVHWATVCGEVEALRAVISAGANITIADINGGSPLHYAAQMCGASYEVKFGTTNSSKLALDILNILLVQSQSNVDVQDKDGRQPLLWAASAGSSKAIIALVKAGARIESADKDGLTALHCAASRGHTNCIDTLISLCGASTELIDSNGCTALHYAVTLGHADATSYLLNLDADPNRQDRKGRTPAHCGCAKGQFETVKLLKEHGANLWLRNAKGDLPVHEATFSGRRELVKWLLEQRPQQVNTTSNDGRSMLHIAAHNDYIDLCKILLDFGAEINSVYRNTKGAMITPLESALQRGHRSTAKFLQSHGGLPAGKLNINSRYSHLNPFKESIVNEVYPLKSVNEDSEETQDLADSEKNIVYLRHYKDKDKKYEGAAIFDENKEEMNNSHRYMRHRKYKRHLIRHRSNSCSDPKIYTRNCNHMCRSKSNIEIRNKTLRKHYSSTSVSDDEDSCENCCYHKYLKKHVILKKKSKIYKYYESDDENISNSETDSKECLHNDNHKVQFEMKDKFLDEENNKLKFELTNLQNSENNENNENNENQITESTIPIDSKVTSHTDVLVIEMPVIESQEKEQSLKIMKDDKTLTDEISVQMTETLDKTTIIAENIISEVKDLEQSNENSQIDENNLKEISSVIVDLDTQPTIVEQSKENKQIDIDEKDKEEEIEEVKDTEKKIESVKFPLKLSDERMISTEDTEKHQTISKNETITIPDSKLETADESQLQLNSTIPSTSHTEFMILDDKGEENIISPETSKPYTLLSDDMSPEKNESTDLNQVERKTSFQILDSDDSVEFFDDHENNTDQPNSPVFTVLSDSQNQYMESNIENSAYKNNISSVKFSKLRNGKTTIKMSASSLIRTSYAPVMNGRKKRLRKRSKNDINTDGSWSKTDDDKKGIKSNTKDQDSGFEPSPRNKHSKIPIAREIYIGRTSIGQDMALEHISQNTRLGNRKPGDKGACDMIAVTKSIQRNIRRYCMERKIFQHLLDLKSLQIRSTKLNEALLVKRAVNDYHKSCVAVGSQTGMCLRRYNINEYTFKNFELFLYETLKSLQKPGTHNFQNLEDVYMEAEKRLSPESKKYEKALQCTSKTHRCFHAAHAYTGIPCAAYIPMMNHHTMPKFGFGSYKKSNIRSLCLPKILTTQTGCNSKFALELSHGKNKQLITLPSDNLDVNKRYYVTFSVNNIETDDSLNDSKNDLSNSNNKENL